MKKYIDKEKIKKIYYANQAFKGTKNWYKYSMWYEYKIDGDKNWHECKLYTYPMEDIDYIVSAYVKTTKTGDWLYILLKNDGFDRYLLNDAVKELLEV